VSASSLAPRDQKTQQYGASIGGPIVKDRLFFFGSWDKQSQSTFQPVSTTILDPDIFAKYPALTSTPTTTGSRTARFSSDASTSRPPTSTGSSSGATS